MDNHATPERLAAFRKTFQSMTTSELKAIVERRKPHKLSEEALSAMRLLLAERQGGGQVNVQPPGIPNIRHDSAQERHSSVSSPPGAETKPERTNGWGGEKPPVLKQPEGRARISAAIGGIILSICVAVLCFFVVPHESIIGRMFDLRKVEAVVPMSIVAVFFWGFFLCWHRWQRVQACEEASGSKLLAMATFTLSEKGIQALSAQLDQPDAEFNPLLRRLKALISQWQLSPGLVEADLTLQQFVADDGESTRRAYSLIRTFVWALPVMGLIGTVLGIAFAVGGFANFLGGKVDDVEAIKTSLVGVTGGLSFAFLLTLLGLATSLVLMLVASSLETREERLYQDIQQRVVGMFLPVLQRVCPAEGAGKTKADLIVDPLKTAADSILDHVAKLAETQAAKLSELLLAQQQQVTAWGQGLQDPASSAAAVVKASLEDAAKNLRESGSEFLARLDLVRQTWKEQTDIMQTALQTQTNQALTTQLQAAAQQQAQASQSLAATLQSMQVALGASATAVQSLEAGLRRLADSPLEHIATALAKSLEDVSKESEKVTKTRAKTRSLWTRWLRSAILSCVTPAWWTS